MIFMVRQDVEGTDRPRVSRAEIAECLFSQGSLGFTVRGAEVRLVASSGNPGRFSHIIVPERRATESEGGGFVAEGRYAGRTPAAAVEGLLQGRGHFLDALSNAVLEAGKKRN